jgi:hypothetical protein
MAYGRLRLETTLPLYFCSLFWLLMPIVAFAKKESYIHRASVACASTFCFACGILGMVFNVYLNHYPFISFVPLRSMAYHFMMVLVPYVMWTSGYYRPERKDRYLFFVPVLAITFPASIVDKLFGWDYCYFNGGRGTPFECISRGMPHLAFIAFLYILILLLTNIIFYVPAMHKQIKEQQEDILVKI